MQKRHKKITYNEEEKNQLSEIDPEVRINRQKH